MKCERPITLKNDGSKAQLERTRSVPCGTCYACLSNRRKEWHIRLLEESKNCPLSFFVTYTYSDKYLPWGQDMPSLYMRDFQNYMKRLRKKCKNVRFYMVGEYGTRTGRSHYHAILFNVAEHEMSYITSCWSYYDKKTKITEPLGNVVISLVNERNLNYVCKYHVNKGRYVKGYQEPSYVSMSTKPPIGITYVEKMRNFHKSIDNCFYQDYEKKVSLPRLYKEKAYSKGKLKLIRKKYEDKKSIDLSRQDGFKRLQESYKKSVDLDRVRESQFKEKRDSSNQRTIL